MCPLAIHQITTRGVPIVFAFAFAPLVGCSKPAVQFDQNWSPPVKVSESIDGFVGGVDLYRWQNTIMALQGLDDGSAKCFMFNRSGGNDAWAEVPLTGVPRGYIWARPAMDQASDKTFFQDGYMENDELVMKVLIGRLTGSLAVRDVKEEKWLTDRKTLFGDARPNERLNKPGKRNWPSLGLGLVNGEDLYIPYRINGETFNENTVFLSKGPFNNGAFHSTDSGMTWQLEQISDFAAWLPSMCKTKLYYYYFAVKNYQRDLWFSRKPVGGSSWEGPKVVTDTFCDSALHWQYVAAASGDTVHLCWLDRRHEKRRADPVDANRENYEVMYCQRKDADADWGKDIILSKGLLYSYRPCMSVEGDKIVVAWSGVQTAGDGHVENGPNDIYYVTSKDSGKTWAKPLKITDRANDGIASGEPRVLLFNGVIHLFYIQGKRESQQLSPGLTKLNQPPWPIYYTQRPFPD